MTIKEFKKLILEEKLDDYDLVISKVGEINEELSYRLDIPITYIQVDTESKEVCIVIENNKDDKHSLPEHDSY